MTGCRWKVLAILATQHCWERVLTCGHGCGWLKPQWKWKCLNPKGDVRRLEVLSKDIDSDAQVHKSSYVLLLLFTMECCDGIRLTSDMS